MITADEALATLQRQLDDTDGEQVSRELLLTFLQDGYDRLCREGECLFDIEMYESRPRTANYTREFERQFIDTPVMERFTCTRETDAEFTDGDALVSNHTRPSDATYMTEAGHGPTKTGLRKLPPGYVSVDRVTHHWLRLSPQHDRYNRMTRVAYQTLEGGVFIYQMDQDGWQNIRLVNVPAFENETETFEYNKWKGEWDGSITYDKDDVVTYVGTGWRSLSDTNLGREPPTAAQWWVVYPAGSEQNFHGGIRRVTSYDMDVETVIGTYGGVRVVPMHFASGSQYGGVRKFVGDLNNTRVEYYRLGKPLDEAPFEIPDRMVKYAQWWALHRVYSLPGENESPKLAEHFKMRFLAGIERLKNRVNSVNRDRAIAMGSKRNSIRDNYLEHFPASFGYSRPFRR
jgi:hypothetical protein